MDIKDIKEVQLRDIQLQGINVRSDLFTQNSQMFLDELAESIRVNGLMQPIVLKGTFGDPPYDVVVGQRRYLAHKKLNRKTILATFTGEISDMDALALSLSENLLRQDLNFIDTMNAVTTLYIHYGRDERKVKAKLGLSIKSIRRFIRIQESGTEKIKKLLEEKKISPQDAKRVITAAQGDSQKADALVDLIVEMSKPQKIRAVEFGENHPEASLEQITKFATTPKIEPTVIVNLPIKIQKALEAAVGQVQQDPEEIILGALKDWLVTNDFFTE